jgi:glycosyltransferase involved in cell wall biosynthesis
LKVINQVIYAENPYHRILYAGLEGRYEPVRADVDAAIDAIRVDGQQILHIHWEEHAIRHCVTAVEARASTDYFLRRLADFRKLGGRVLWTVHNLMPHELQHPEVFIELRRGLAHEVDVILVHNLEAINVLRAQVALEQSKLFYLPHPSYLGVYEPEEETEQRALAAPRTRHLLAFGKMRRYKGFDTLLDFLPEQFLTDHDLTLSIVGQPLPQEDFAEALATKAAGRQRVTIEPRNVPDEDVATLFRGAECLVLPYERFLTSGVALLALTLGVPTIAPATNAMRELFPALAHPLLYRPGEVEDFQRAVSETVGLAASERADLVRALVARARYLRPEKTGALLGALYDRVLAA